MLPSRGGAWRWREVAPLLCVLTAYAVAAVCILPVARGQLNPDGVSYILVARRLLSGDLYGAVSAHWSPLFSWLLIPLFALRIEPLLACKLLTDAIGAATLVAFWRLAPRFTSRSGLRIAITAVFTPIVLLWASSLITPDLLLVCILLFVFLAELRYLRGGRKRTAIVVGLLGGVAYLAKSYALPFFAAQFTLLQVVRWRIADSARDRESVARGYLAGMAAFVLVALPWIAILSTKYGHLTIGAAASYSFHVIGPLVRGQHPVHTAGLISPSDAEALSIWDDPSGLRFPPWPMEPRNLLYLGRLAIGNVIRLLGIVESWSLLALPLLLLVLDGVLRRHRTSERRMLLAGTLATMTLFAAGFLPLLLEERYLWFVEVLLLLLAAAFLDELTSRRQIVAALVVLSFLARPILHHRLDRSGRVAQEQAKALARAGIDLRGARLAADKGWEPTLCVNFYLGARDYGVLPPGSTNTEIRRQLDQHRIDTFLLWSGAPPTYLEGFHRTAVVPHAFAVYQRGRSPGSRMATIPTASLPDARFRVPRRIEQELCERRKLPLELLGPGLRFVLTIRRLSGCH